MHYFKNKALLVSLCLVISGNKSMALPSYGYPIDVNNYLPAVVGSLLIGYSASPARSTEEDLFQGYAEELKNNIESRRVAVYATIEKLQHRLNVLQAQRQVNNAPQSVEEQRIIRTLEKAREEYRATDIDYQAEYIRIRPRARLVKNAGLAGVAAGSFLLVYNIAHYLAHKENREFFNIKLERSLFHGLDKQFQKTV